MLVYTLWSSITFATIDKGWLGSLVYIPHGCRVIFYCFFGVRSLPALYAAEIINFNLKTEYHHLSSPAKVERHAKEMLHMVEITKAINITYEK